MRDSDRRQAATKARPRRAGWLRAAAIPLALIAPGTILNPVPAAAQDNPFGFVGRIFGGGQQQRRYIDPPPNAGPRPKYYIDPPVSPSRRAQPDKPRSAPKRQAPGSDAAATGAGAAATRTAEAAKPVEKAADAKVVLVVGDFMALSLAKGLEASVADKPGIRIADRTDGSSGLVRDDHFDWPDRIGAIIDEEKPAAVAVMLGTNDRQTMRDGGEAMDLRGEEWAAEYKLRIDALAKAVRDRKLPLVWVGLPGVKSTKASDDLAYFNELYREAATEVGGEFVDVWDGFVDADGAFVSSGPDIAGQPARLRNSDGITMTPQGARKLAFFAEKPLEKLFGAGFEGAVAAAQPDAAKAVPQNPANATAMPVVAMNSPSLDGGETLLGGAVLPGTYPSQPSPRERLVLSGAPLPAASGRADDFAWSEKAGPVAPDRGAAPIVSRGSVSLQDMRSAKPLQPATPTPPLQDAIIEDWSNQSKAGGDAAPDTAPAAPPR
ncbi:SGNH/GDSL hydrolase family protein [Aureimonas psammosilenae]|uniref:SGNH/GDSL hydrolase family protein n=1 Tax=Aureimonas psammosilenae TaxID=2495496 RepID=UPI001260E837|nr:SGNH family hydrolase [Aureimonas psammosilenae]